MRETPKKKMKTKEEGRAGGGGGTGSPGAVGSGNIGGTVEVTKVLMGGLTVTRSKLIREDL